MKNGAAGHLYTVSVNGRIHEGTFVSDVKEAEDSAIELARRNPGNHVLVLELVAAFGTQAPRVERVPLTEVLAS